MTPHPAWPALAPASARLLSAVRFGLLLLAAGCGPGVVQQELAIGQPCSAASDCGTAPTFYCETALPGGYCKKDCRTDLDCPTEAVCVGAAGLTTGSCYLICGAGSTCPRQGYGCLPASSTPPLTATRNYCDFIH
jgi:hypothetical protein